MGWEIAGHVSAEKPDGAKLADLWTAVPYRIYRHKSSEVWMISTSIMAEDNAPFADTGVKDSVKSIARVFPPLADIIRGLGPLRPYNYGMVVLCCELSRLLGIGLFSFVSDDESSHLTCQAQSGCVERLHWRMEDIEIVYEGRTFTARMWGGDNVDNEVCTEVLRPVLDTLGSGGVTILEPHLQADGQILHQIVVEDWPPSAGDPVKLCNLGTFDPFQDFAAEWDLVEQGWTGGNQSFWRRLFG